MTKGLKILIAAVSIIFLTAVIAVIISMKKSDKTYVEILQNNRVIYAFDLSQEKNRTFRVENPDGGWNDIKIENGTICMYDADCPDHICVKTGVLRSESLPIVCLPHRLVIRFADKEK